VLSAQGEAADGRDFDEEARDMPRHRYRNPRFAPEFLERKLSPSSVTMSAAIVVRLDDPEPLPPHDEPGSPRPIPPDDPTIPVLPG
jgi:hypothetical protein